MSVLSERVYRPVSKRHQSQFFDGAVKSSTSMWLRARAPRTSRRQSAPAVMSCPETKQVMAFLLRLSIKCFTRSANA
jgi:hypothetical protein